MLLIFLSLILISALCVIISKNIVQSVLYLILVFFLCSLLFIYLGADFIGLIILIVYIGAIAVLFLFVVMMLNVRVLEISSNFSIYLPLSIFLSFIFLCQVAVIYVNSLGFTNFGILSFTDWSTYSNSKIVSIGELLFNEFYILFIGATFLLFVAMIGAIILVLEKKTNTSTIGYRLGSTQVINWIFKK